MHPTLSHWHMMVNSIPREVEMKVFQSVVIGPHNSQNAQEQKRLHDLIATADSFHETTGKNDAQELEKKREKNYLVLMFSSEIVRL